MISKQPVALTEEQSKQVSGGASLNIFVDTSTMPPTASHEETGSQLHGNMGASLGGNGTLNQNHHFTV
jgi:hypothetical protein